VIVKVLRDLVGRQLAYAGAFGEIGNARQARERLFSAWRTTAR